MNTQKSIKNFSSCQMMWTRRFIGPNNQELWVICQYNSYYGELMTRLEINGKTHTDVKSVFDGELLELNISNGLLGTRPFINDSIFFEYVYVPLGLDKLDLTKIKATGKDGWNVLYEHYYSFLELITQIGWKEDESAYFAMKDQ